MKAELILNEKGMYGVTMYLQSDHTYGPNNNPCIAFYCHRENYKAIWHSGATCKNNNKYPHMAGFCPGCDFILGMEIAFNNMMLDLEGALLPPHMWEIKNTRACRSAYESLIPKTYQA